MNPLDKFGRLFVESFRDQSLDYLQGMFDGKWNAPDLQPLQYKVSSLSSDQKTTIRELVEDLLTHAMHDVLFALQEYHENGIEIMVDGESVLSDEIHGEIFGEEGWIVRYSKYPSEVKTARSRWAEQEIKRMFGNDGGTGDTQ